MGTSKSSPGSPGGVPMVPPWASPVPNDKPTPADKPQKESPGEGQEASPPQAPQPNNPKHDTKSPPAPAGRFSGARSSLGKFAKDGSSENMRRGVSSYVKTGLGGRKQATARLASTANTAGLLYNALTAASGISAPTQKPLERQLLEGRSVEEISSAIVEATRPVDGTQDGESSRASINDALAELMERYPEVDLLNLEAIHKDLVVEAYVSNDLYRRIVLDVGNAIRSKAPNHAAASARFKEVKDFIRETIAAAFRTVKARGGIVGQNVASTVHSAFEETFRVFEEYV